MFLSLLTADAAAQHGHEFSVPRAPTTIHHTTPPPPRSPLNLLTSTICQQRHTFSPEAAAASAVKDAGADSQPSQRSIMFALPNASSPSSTRPPSLRSTTTTSTDERSRRRPARPKTSYALAHPPPRVGPLHLRPKVLLQLQQSSTNSRAKPAFEAIPSTIFAPRLKRKFHGVFQHRDRLGPDDVVIVRAADYSDTDEHGDSDRRLEARDVVGVVCFSIRDERTEICMDDDMVWEARAMPNGGYEFMATDGHGLQSKARWVLKSPTNNNNARKSASSQTDIAAEDRRFAFSTISPDRRRHPVIATMTRAGIDVWDQYTIPSPTTTAASPTLGDGAASQPLADIAENRPMLLTDEALRKFVLASGIWVAFREKWSNVFRYEKLGRERDATPSSPVCGSPILPCAPVRTFSMASVNGSFSRSSSPGIPDSRSEKHHSLKSVSRLIMNRNTALAALNGESVAAEPCSPSTAQAIAATARAQRANSTGTAFIKRVSSKKRPMRRSSSDAARVTQSAGSDMYRIRTREESDRDHRFTLGEGAHIMLPMIEDRTPKNSGEYASSVASSSADASTPHLLPRGRASVHVPPTYLQSKHSVSSHSPKVAERPTPPRPVSLADEPRPRLHGTEGISEASVEIGVGGRWAFSEGKCTGSGRRVSVRGLLQRMRSKKERS